MFKAIYLYLVLLLFTSLPLAKASNDELNEDEKINQVLNRLTYGPKPGDFEYIKKIGLAKFIDQQLNPESYNMPDYLLASLKDNEAIMLSPGQIDDQYGRKAIKDQNPDITDKAELNKMLAKNFRKFYLLSAKARFERAMSSPRQLQEVMTDFWFNHFNVSHDKGLVHFWVGNYEERAIRANALGNFRDLLGATANHAAMLFYLDNFLNSYAKPNGKTNQKQKLGINENYAREIMELHTLGVKGGYHQDDVISLAHILTGLSILRPKIPANAIPNQALGSCFYPNRHDFSEQTVIGQKISSGSLDQINQALDLLANAPATAHHISYEIAQYFLCDDPPESLVNSLAQTFTETHGNIKEVMKSLINSKEFFDPKYYRVKYKSPYRYVVSVLRLSDLKYADLKNPYGLIGILNQMGEPLYSCLTPDGYKCTKEAWLSPQSLLQRISFATACGSGKFLTGNSDAINYDRIYPLFKDILSKNTNDTIQNAPKQLQTALLLGSPEIMYY